MSWHAAGRASYTRFVGCGVGTEHQHAGAENAQRVRVNSQLLHFAVFSLFDRDVFECRGGGCVGKERAHC